MKIRVSLILVLVLGVFIFPGCGQVAAVKMKVQGDENIALARGQVLELGLESNPTTGYSWQVSGPGKGNVLERVGKPVYSIGSDRIGAGGIEKYRFKAVSKGSARIVFEYQRPWEKEPIKRYVINLTVQ